MAGCVHTGCMDLRPADDAGTRPVDAASPAHAQHEADAPVTPSLPLPAVPPMPGDFVAPAWEPSLATDDATRGASGAT